MVSQLKIVSTLFVHCFLRLGKLVGTPDPCPPKIEDKINVATMCQNSNATEHNNDGRLDIDSVVLRVMTQRDNCVCMLKLEYAVNDRDVILQKYDNLDKSAPTTASCGLEIDIRLSNSTQNLDPIACLKGYDNRLLTVSDLQTMYLTSRISKGTFRNGYCLLFHRKSTTTTTPTTLKLNCHEVVTTTVKSTEYYSSTDFQSHSSLMTHPTDSTSHETNMSIPISTPSDGSINYKENKTEEEKLKWFVISGSSAGGSILIVIILVFFAYKCRKNNKHKPTQQTNSDSNNEDSDFYGLKDNILYVSSDDINAFVGNYAYVDSNTNTTEEDVAQINESTTRKEKDNTSDVARPKPTVKSKPSNSRADNINVVYAVVNKANQEQTSGASLVDSKNEYAVVNKTGVQ